MLAAKAREAKLKHFNGRVYHAIAIVKERDNDKKLGHKIVWHVIAEETITFKTSKFCVTKSEMPKYMCE